MAPTDGIAVQTKKPETTMHCKAETVWGRVQTHPSLVSPSDINRNLAREWERERKRERLGSVRERGGRQIVRGGKKRESEPRSQSDSPEDRLWPG